ncbi:MAG: hypothetical protein RIN55_09070 [Tissierellaceae bacterium]|nr:hypothetical protein [Tissierellaceae bacterium]
MEKNSILDVILRRSRRILSSEDKIRNLSIILFWGSIWGILEATVGLFLHAFPFKIPTGSIMFPIGYYFMQKSYKATNQLNSMFYTSAVAASIKLVNLFSPVVPIIKVLNPAGCILLEGLGVVLVFKYVVKDEKSIKFIHALTMSFLWRVGYYMMCLGIFVPLGMIKNSSILNMSYVTEFFFRNAFINSILIYLYSKVQYKNYKESTIKYNPLLSSSALILAIIVTWIV